MKFIIIMCHLIGGFPTNLIFILRYKLLPGLIIGEISMNVSIFLDILNSSLSPFYKSQSYTFLTCLGCPAVLFLCCPRNLVELARRFFAKKRRVNLVELVLCACIDGWEVIVRSQGLMLLRPSNFQSDFPASTMIFADETWICI